MEVLSVTLAALMVSVDFDQSSSARIKLAAELAHRFNSMLIGVAGWPLLKRSHKELELPQAGSFESVSKELEKLGEQFRTIVGEITDRVEWRCSMDFPREVIPKEARAADLIIIGKGILPGDVAHTYDPETSILAAGRPVLVVPPEIERHDFSRPLIA